MACFRQSLRARAPLASLNRHVIRLFTAVVLALAGTTALGADFYAAPGGSASGTCVDTANACTIQRAIDVAAPYDTVRVAAGDYAFTSNRIRIEKEGLRLIGDNSPFAAAYATPPGPGQVAHGTLGNKAANASVLKAATAVASPCPNATTGMVWVRIPASARMNLYIEVNASTPIRLVGSCPFQTLTRAKEGIVASGTLMDSLPPTIT